MAPSAPQLTLDLFGATTHDFADFLPGPNAESVAGLERWCQGGGPRVVYLWGAPASGKSHLLHASIRAAGAAGARAMYVPLADLLEAGPSILDGLDSIDLIALDDITACAGNAAWERRLFHLYNAIMAADGRLLWTSGASPARAFFQLPDLASRLAGSLVYQLRELNDADKAAALQHAAQRRGLALSEAVAEFILRRESRNMARLSALIDALDRASLRDARALTLPYVRAVLDADAREPGRVLSRPASDA